MKKLLIAFILFIVLTAHSGIQSRDVTDIVCILDRSGSMGSITSDTIGGFNMFLKSQKKLSGLAEMTIVLFNNGYEIYVDNEDIHNIKPLNSNTYVPEGSTALLDAIGKTINQLDGKVTDRVIVCILTDGLENSSVEFTIEQIKNMVEHRQDTHKWEFVFLGANMDAFSVGNSYGFTSNNINLFTSDSVGIGTAFDSINTSVSGFRIDNSTK